MPPILALIVCVAAVIVLLRIERKDNPTASLALWVPTLWMLIYASRPIGLWFKSAPILSDAGEADLEVGSPIDRYVLSILIALALLILSSRKLDWPRIWKDNVWLIVWFLFLGISIAWSPIPFVSFKRWFRSTGDVFVAMVVMSELRPFRALESVLRRCMYILIPFSLLLIKYYPYLGRSYGHISGMEMWIGVTLQKNSLGQLCALSCFFLIWSFLRSRGPAGLQGSKARSIGDVFILVIALGLLIGPSSYSRSATSVGILVIGTAILVLLYPREGVSRYIAGNLKALAVLFSVAYLLLYDSIVSLATSLLERDSTLTGRTEIWGPLLDFASANPLLGVGYGGFWAPGNLILEELFTPQFILTQAHNGYLAIYVELGIVGLVLLALFILAFCGKIRRELGSEYDWGLYGIALVPMLLIYNNSEVSFMNSSSLLWTTVVFLMVIFSASRLKKGSSSTLAVHARWNARGGKVPRSTGRL